MNVTKKTQEKDNYGPLIRMLQVKYPEYKFWFIPVIVGAMRNILLDLKTNVKKLEFDENEVAKMMKMIQQKSITGSEKTCTKILNYQF